MPRVRPSECRAFAGQDAASAILAFGYRPQMRSASPLEACAAYVETSRVDHLRVGVKEAESDPIVLRHLDHHSKIAMRDAGQRPEFLDAALGEPGTHYTLRPGRAPGHVRRHGLRGLAVPPRELSNHLCQRQVMLMHNQTLPVDLSLAGL